MLSQQLQPADMALSAPPATLQATVAMLHVMQWLQQRMPSSHPPSHTAASITPPPAIAPQQDPTASDPTPAPCPSPTALHKQLRQAATAMRRLHAACATPPADITCFPLFQPAAHWQFFRSNAATAADAALAGAEATLVRVLCWYFRDLPQMSRSMVQSLVQLNMWALRAVVQQVSSLRHSGGTAVVSRLEHLVLVAHTCDCRIC